MAKELPWLRLERYHFDESTREGKVAEDTQHCDGVLVPRPGGRLAFSLGSARREESA
jgi:hypothetical protein